MPDHEVAEQPAVPEPAVRPEGHAAPSEHVVAVVGAGPRGTSFLERLLAHLEELPAGGRSQAPWLRVLVIDSAVHGPGRVWDPRQSPLHLMNTPASYPTVAPVGRTGEQLASSSISLSFSQWRRRRGLVDEDAPDTDFPRRADYGRYLAEMHRQAVQTLQDRPGVAVESIHASAIALEREDADDAASASRLTLDDGTVRRADSVVLAVGHVPARLNDAGARTASAAEELGLRHIAPAVPTDVDVESFPAGETVLIRGMGLNFFDLMIRATVGRGGRFRWDPQAEAGRRCAYAPAGREPLLVAGSRRGAPYRAKTGAPGFVPAGIRLVHLTDAAIEEAERRHGALDFAAHLWPLIARDVLATYYRTLVEVAGELFDDPAGFLEAFDALLRREDLGEQVLASRGQALLHGHAPDAIWLDVRSLGRPFDGVTFASAAQHREHMLAYLEDDAASSAAGAASPVKMAIGAMHAARMRLKALISEGRVAEASRIEDVEGWFEPLIEGLASGPPMQRIEELAALVRAGVVDILGPDPLVDVDRGAGCFTAESPCVEAEPVTARWLVEAMMPANRVRLSDSPLVRSLLASGLARSQEVVDVAGAPRAGKGFAVTAAPHRLVDASGAASPSIYVLGLQLSSVQWGTAIAAEAGGDPQAGARTLADADAAAGSVVQTALGAAVPEAPAG